MYKLAARSNCIFKTIRLLDGFLIQLCHFFPLKYRVEPLLTNSPNKGHNRKNLHNKDKRIGLVFPLKEENLYITAKVVSPKMSVIERFHCMGSLRRRKVYCACQSSLQSNFISEISNQYYTLLSIKVQI